MIGSDGEKRRTFDWPWMLGVLSPKLGSSNLALSPPKTKKKKEVTEDYSLLPL